MSCTWSEASAITAARAGDADAFAVLVERYQQLVFRAAWLIVRDAPAAEDIAQESFLRAYRALSSFDTEGAFRPWLLRIATNLALNEVRRRRRRDSFLARAGRLFGGSSPPPEEDAIASEQRDAVWHAINELPEQDRLLFYLRYYLDLPLDDIARVLDVRTGTVKSRLHRAGKRLRGVIEARYPTLQPDRPQRPPGSTHD